MDGRNLSEVRSFRFVLTICRTNESDSSFERMRIGIYRESSFLVVQAECGSIRIWQ